jgi:hypothetical protein
MTVGDSISTSIGMAFAGLIRGTLSVKQAMAAMAKSILTTIIDMVKQIVMANAVSAAAGAASSQAGIPVIGPVLAGAAMVAMLSMVQGLLGDLPSAATGWDRLPSDQLVQAHKGERIIPSYDADRLDALAANGGGINVTIHATDAKSVRRLFLDNDAALAEALRQAARKGRA